MGVGWNFLDRGLQKGSASIPDWHIIVGAVLRGAEPGAGAGGEFVSVDSRMPSAGGWTEIC